MHSRKVDDVFRRYLRSLRFPTLHEVGQRAIVATVRDHERHDLRRERARMQPGEPKKKLPRELLVQRAVEADPKRGIGLVLYARSELVGAEQGVEPAPPVIAR